MCQQNNLCKLRHRNSCNNNLDKICLQERSNKRYRQVPFNPVMMPTTILLIILLNLTITFAAPPIVNSDTEGTRLKATRTESNSDSDDDSDVTTPEVPFHFECEDEGFFVNPKDCRKYFWCLDSKPANLGIVAHAFTCPSGLYFNSKTDACDYPDNVSCKQAKQRGRNTETNKKKKSETSSSRNRNRNKVTTTTTTTEAPTTSTTTAAPTSTTPVITPELLAAALRLNERTQTTPSTPKQDNLYQLLQLVQSLGGVDRLKSLLDNNDELNKDMISDRNESPSSGTRTFIRVNSRLHTQGLSGSNSNDNDGERMNNNNQGNNGRRPTHNSNHGSVDNLNDESLNENLGHIPSYVQPMRKKSVRVRTDSSWPALPTPPSPQLIPTSSGNLNGVHRDQINNQLLPLLNTGSGPRKVTRVIEVTTEAPHALAASLPAVSSSNTVRHRRPQFDSLNTNPTTLPPVTTTINPFNSYADPARGNDNRNSNNNNQGNGNSYEFNYNIPSNRQSLSSPLLSDPVNNEPLSNQLLNSPLMNTNNPFADPFFTYNTPDRFAIAGSTSAATFATEPTTLFDNLSRNSAVNERRDPETRGTTRRETSRSRDHSGHDHSGRDHAPVVRVRVPSNGVFRTTNQPNDHSIVLLSSPPQQPPVAVNNPPPRGSGRRATRVRASNFNLNNNAGPRIVTGNINLPEFNSHPGVLYDESALTESPSAAALSRQPGHDHSDHIHASGREELSHDHSGHDHSHQESPAPTTSIPLTTRKPVRRRKQQQSQSQNLRSSSDRSVNPVNALISLPPPNLIPRDGPSIIRILDNGRIENLRPLSVTQNDNRQSVVRNNWNSQPAAASSPRPLPPRPNQGPPKVLPVAVPVFNVNPWNWQTPTSSVSGTLPGQSFAPTVTTSSPAFTFGPNTIHFSNIPSSSSRGTTHSLNNNNNNQLTTRSPVGVNNRESSNNNGRDNDHRHSHVEGHNHNDDNGNINHNPFNDEVFVTEFPFYDYNTNPPSTTTTTTQAPTTTTLPTTTRNSWRNNPVTTARSLPSTRGFNEQDLANHWSIVTDAVNEDRRTNERVTPSTVNSNANSGRSRSRNRIELPPSRPSTTSTTTQRPLRFRDEVDPSDVSDPASAPVAMGNGGIVACTRRGVYAHPQSCGQFVVCAPVSRGSTKYRSYEHHCPAEQVFVEEVGRCRPGNKEKCEVYT